MTWGARSHLSNARPGQPARCTRGYERCAPKAEQHKHVKMGQDDATMLWTLFSSSDIIIHISNGDDGGEKVTIRGGVCPAHGFFIQRPSVACPGEKPHTLLTWVNCCGLKSRRRLSYCAQHRTHQFELSRLLPPSALFSRGICQSACPCFGKI